MARIDGSVEFLAAIAGSPSAIKFDGSEGEGGRLTLEIPGDEAGHLAKLLLLRGQRLRVRIEVDGEDKNG